MDEGLGELGYDVSQGVFQTSPQSSFLRDGIKMRIAIPRCPLCQGAADSRYWRADLLGPGKQIRWCSVCGFGWQHPLPEKTLIHERYIHSTYMVQSESEKEKGFQRRILKLNQHFPYRGRLLDVGCGFGHFLKLARNAGWQAIGIDPNSKAAKYCQDQTLNVFLGDFENFDLEPNSFDVITLWDVWEHVFDPVNFLDDCLKLLCPGGILSISIPNASGWPARLFKGHWRYVMPAHINYFKLNFIKYLMRNRTMHILHADHMIKVQSLLQGIVSILPLNLNFEKFLRVGRITDNSPSPLDTNFKNELNAFSRLSIINFFRKQAFIFNQRRFLFPIGDIADYYFLKG